MTLESLLSRAESYLSGRGVPEARANAEFLMACALGVHRGELELRRALPAPSGREKRFWGWVLRRGCRVPLAYVLGSQPFHGLELRVGPGVLIPRPETEELADIAILLARRLRLEGRRTLRVLDVGTGSGCIALALARALPGADIAATDVSPKALETARGNARRLGCSSRIRFLPARAPLRGWRADLVVSNPPYIPSARLRRLEPEVLREPRLALDGGPDGLKVIRRVIALAAGCLATGGRLAMEIDAGQGAQVRELLKARGFSRVEIRRDLRGSERFAAAALGFPGK